MNIESDCTLSIMVSSSPGPSPLSPVDVNTYVPEVVDVWPRLHGDSRYYLCLQGRSDQVSATSNLIESLMSRQCRLAWHCAIPHRLITSPIINTSDSMISTLTINPFNVNRSLWLGSPRKWSFERPTIDVTFHLPRSLRSSRDDENRHSSLDENVGWTTWN